MITKLWETAGAKLAERWLSAGFMATIFWLLGAATWVVTHGGVDELTRWSVGVAGLPAVGQLTAVLIGLGVVGASALVVNRLTEPAFRLLEGYWPLWMLRAWHPAIVLERRWAGRREKRWADLAAQIDSNDATLTPADYALYLRLDKRQRAEPLREYRRMPTRVGAVLRAAESRPYERYGLETIAVWPRLWLVLPEVTREQLGLARKAMLDTTAVVVWSLLFTTFGWITPWAAVAGVLVAAVVIHFWLPARAELFSDLLESAFDLHRIALYKQLRWPVPSTPADEREMGMALSRYLWRGSDASKPVFTDPS